MIQSGTETGARSFTFSRRSAVSAARDTAGHLGGGLGDAVLRALFTKSPVGLLVFDTGLRIVHMNIAARNVRAFPVEEFLGFTLAEALQGFNRERAAAVEVLAREVLESGTPRRDVQVTARSRHAPYREFALSTSWFQLSNERGQVLGVAASITDVTERHKAQARLVLLEGASARIGTTLDVFRTAQDLADATVPDFADTTTVDLLDPVLRGEALEPGPQIEHIELRRGGWHSMRSIEDPHGPMAGEVSGLPPGSPYRDALADLRPRLIKRLDPHAAWLQSDPLLHRLLGEVQVHSMIVVPLHARGLVLGLACFYRWRSPDAYADDDRVLAQQLATRTALCLDNARLYSHGRAAALILQMRHRPAGTPVHSAVESAYSYPAPRSGSGWTDVIALPGARVALVAGNVQGDGLPAVAAMGELRASIGALALMDLPPDELLERLHELVTWLSGQQSPSTHDRSPTAALNATCTYAIYDPTTRHCTIATAGHPQPLLVLPNGTLEIADAPSGPALGQGRPAYQATEHTLPEGTHLILTSTHVPGHLAQSTTRTLDQIQGLFPPGTRSLQASCDTLLRTPIAQNCAVLLLVKTRALGPDRLASWTLQPSPESVAQARKYATAQLAAWDLEDLTFTTELVVSELVTNAVRYSDGPIGLRLIRDRTLTCEVSDTSSTAPQLRRADDSDEGGRGLFITGEITQHWGTRPTRHGKIIWAEQTLPQPTPAQTPAPGH